MRVCQQAAVFFSPTVADHHLIFTAEELAQRKLPNYSKKDVPMWTVEEDLLILQLVEKHGKKWSKTPAPSWPHRQRVRNR